MTIKNPLEHSPSGSGNSTRALAVFVTRPQAVVKSARSTNATPGTARCQLCRPGEADLLICGGQIQVQLGNVCVAFLVVVTLRLNARQVFGGNVAGNINAVEA